ncbi:uncharacterized protein L201_001803 [Kwoniella dendrophila CBS 6074]|uniref:Protein YAE1 n=1 Tax=Kwoniella dendrophila CBS 6074 TaxID=1295534 RepID=A0AAX4JNH8_9TREE
MAYPPVNEHMEDDDDWLEPPTQGGASDPLVNQEYARISNKFFDAGYREGITDGKLSTLQKGFDEGFEISVPLSRKIGLLRGKSSALLSIATSSSSSSSKSSTDKANTNLIEEIREINKQLNKLKRDEILPEDEERLQHEKEEHEDPNNDDDHTFELDQNDKRDLEFLENGFENIGKSSKPDAGGEKRKEDGEFIMRRLEEKLHELEKYVLRR